MLQDVRKKLQKLGMSDERIRELLTKYPPEPVEMDVEECHEDEEGTEQEEESLGPVDPDKSPLHKAVDQALVERVRSALACRGGKLRIYSHTLGEEVWIVSTEEEAEEVKPDVAYTVKECLLLVKLRPSAEALRSIHMVKTTFDGELWKFVQPDAEAPSASTPADSLKMRVDIYV